MSANGKQVSVRLTDEQHEQLETLRGALSTPHVKATLADALRVVVKNGLANTDEDGLPIVAGRPERS